MGGTLHRHVLVNKRAGLGPLSDASDGILRSKSSES